MLTVFVKMRLKVASELLGVIEISRLELLEIANPRAHTQTRRHTYTYIHVRARACTPAHTHISS